MTPTDPSPAALGESTASGSAEDPGPAAGDGSTAPVCSLCRRERTLTRPMDAYGYTPMQVITGQPLGWYSGEDGEICPECMEQSIRGMPR